MGCADSKRFIIGSAVNHVLLFFHRQDLFTILFRHIQIHLIRIAEINACQPQEVPSEAEMAYFIAANDKGQKSKDKGQDFAMQE